MAASTTRIMTVRMKVAKSELMFSMPTLAKIAVSAANAADSSAQNCRKIRSGSLGWPREWGSQPR
ncbi:hypothetical protein AJ88_01430 [Mesorhizobium amorphae CCBAU 01583]|nr:hypothetical protein AJ88_01430 [Mesorhizobium amorphae CCBAU 01583]